MEIDLGEGGKLVDRVIVRHMNDESIVSSNGVTLYVLDEERKVIMQSSFTGLKIDSLPDKEFIIKNPTKPIVIVPYDQIRTVRYLRIARTSGRDNMNECALEGWLGSHTDACDHMHLEQTIFRDRRQSNKCIQFQ